MAEQVYPHAYGVEEVNQYLKQYLEEDDFLANVAIRGEVTAIKRHSSGHIYLTLRENECYLKAVLFRRYAQMIQKLPEAGESVIVIGSITLYERDCCCQLYGRMLMPVGEGAEKLAFEQMKKRLEEEGLFAPERKKPIPKYAMNVGVITGDNSAAWADISRIIKGRCPGAKVTLYPALVQGETAPESIAAALAKADVGGHDVLLCGRGGGAGEDLAPFDTEIVVRALAAVETPVISAVGHESDFTLADLAADVRAATPTHGAAMAVPDVAELLRTVEGYAERIRMALSRRVQDGRNRWQRAAGSIMLTQPGRVLLPLRQRTETAEKAVGRLMTERLAKEEHRLLALVDRLALLNPLSTLERGYSLVSRGEHLVTSADQLTPGDQVRITLSRGSVIATVDHIEEDLHG